MSEQLTVGDIYSINRTNFSDQSDFAAQRFEYLVEKRDTLQGRIRFGALTLNGAALIGLTALLGDKSSAVALLGFDASIAKTSAAMFIVGAIFAAASIFWVGLTANAEVASAFTRMQKAQWLKATFDGELNDHNQTVMCNAMEEFHKAEITDFDYSRVALVSQSVAAACWLVGMIYPLLFTLGWAHQSANKGQASASSAVTQPSAKASPPRGHVLSRERSLKQ